MNPGITLRNNKDNPNIQKRPMGPLRTYLLQRSENRQKLVNKKSMYVNLNFKRYNMSIWLVISISIPWYAECPLTILAVLSIVYFLFLIRRASMLWNIPSNKHINFKLNINMIKLEIDTLIYGFQKYWYVLWFILAITANSHETEM